MLQLDYIVRFLYKYMFILKAASDGWRVKYIGGDSFKFINKCKEWNKSKSGIDTIEDFIYKYQNNILI